ncbi:MAG: hypothetical protein ACLQIB_05220 [Isosphaeraceae bacterium]
MKRTFVGVLCAAFVSSIIPLAGCDSGGDAGMPADKTPGVPLDSMKADLKGFNPKEGASKTGADAKTGTPETKK